MYKMGREWALQYGFMNNAIVAEKAVLFHRVDGIVDEKASHCDTMD